MLFSFGLNFWFSSLHFPNFIYSFPWFLVLGFWTKGWFVKNSGRGIHKTIGKGNDKGSNGSSSFSSSRACCLSGTPHCWWSFACYTGGAIFKLMIRGVLGELTLKEEATECKALHRRKVQVPHSGRRILRMRELLLKIKPSRFHLSRLTFPNYTCESNSTSGRGERVEGWSRRRGCCKN